MQIPNLKLVFVLLGLMITQLCFAQYQIQVLDSNTFNLGEGVVLSKTSFRGLSVVDDNTIWVSGSRGTFARSVDGGKTFTYTQLKGYEKSDFRDIEAFDDKRAVMMSSGTPAYILKTIDGGLTWKEVYKNTDSAYFLDAMDFWDEQRGILVGDPINGHFVLLETNNGGETWQELDTTKTPHAMEGEAVFAASGTSLRCWGKNEFGFVTGGSKSRLFLMKRGSKAKEEYHIKISQGNSSSGTFSFARSRFLWLFAGGDYLRDTSINDANFYYCNTLANKDCSISTLENLNGYKSCIEVISDSKSKYGDPIIIATGTSGTQIGKRVCSYIDTFFSYSNFREPFHVVRKAKKGNAVFLAGPKGKIGKLVN